MNILNSQSFCLVIPCFCRPFVLTSFRPFPLFSLRFLVLTFPRPFALSPLHPLILSSFLLFVLAFSHFFVPYSFHQKMINLLSSQTFRPVIVSSSRSLILSPSRCFDLAFFCAFFLFSICPSFSSFLVFLCYFFRHFVLSSFRFFDPLFLGHFVFSSFDSFVL